MLILSIRLEAIEVSMSTVDLGKVFIAYPIEFMAFFQELAKFLISCFFFTSVLRVFFYPCELVEFEFFKIAGSLSKIPSL